MVNKKRRKKLKAQKVLKGGGAEMQETITLKKCICERCGHKWIPRSERTPVVCAKCNSAYWNIPKKRFGKQPADKK